VAILGRWLFVLMCVGGAQLAVAQPPTRDQLESRIVAVDDVLRQVAGMPDKSVPSDLLRRARGIAVFPAVLKLGLVVGVSFGDGVALRKNEKTGDWSRPAFFKFFSGSLGVQVGAQSTDVILLIMTESALESMLEDKLSLGADISVAAGPVGRLASAETGRARDAAILSYSRSKGLFAGLSLKGGTLTPDKMANDAYHGEGVSPQDVFFENLGSRSDASDALIRTLNDLAR
jgi:lipid-binding SYLF domain-containing protein